jgi:hypothetical protein
VKALTTAIYGKLAGSSLAGDIQDRLYKGQGPAGAAFPYAVYFVVSDVPERTFTERYESVLVQFSLFSKASSSSEVEDMFAHLKALYDECAMSITGYTLIWMRMVNANLMVEDVETPDGTQQAWHYAVDFEVFMSLN